MSINTLIKELKNNNEDFEFYPTSKNMIDVIIPYLDHETVLDIGCGTCNFKKFVSEVDTKKIEKYFKVNKNLLVNNNLKLLTCG